jgi:beta-lactamase regulating signal transducer with metallopeptidase domain
MPPLLNMILSNAVMASLLALLAAGVTYWVRRPALSHCLWLLVLLKLLTPPIVPFEISWSSKEKTPAAEDSKDVLDSEAIDQSEPANVPPVPSDAPVTTILIYPADPESTEPAESTPVAPNNLWMDLSERAMAFGSYYLAPIWLTGSCLWLGWTILHLYLFQRILFHAEKAPEHLQNEVRDWAAKLGMHSCPALWLVPGCVSPMLWTIGWAPRLLFPAKLLERLDDEQRSALLIHELAHLRRRDHWVRWIELAVMTIYWWNPIVWLARRELHEAEEQCCDAWVVWTLMPGGPGSCRAGRAYALALLHTVDFFSHARPTLPATASGVGQVPHLRRRLTMIMNGNTPRSLSSAGRLAVLGLGLLLPLVPVQAQTEPQDPKDDRDRQIEKLKKVIQALEQQKNADLELRDIRDMQNGKDFLLKQLTDQKVLRLELAKDAEKQLKQAQANEAKARANQAQAEEQRVRAVRFLSEAQLAQNQNPDGRVEFRAFVLDDKAGPEVQKMMKAIEDLTRALEAKRQELRGLEEKLQHTRAQLEKMRAEGAVNEAKRRAENERGKAENARKEVERRIEVIRPDGAPGREQIIIKIDPSASPDQVKKQVEEIQARVKQPIRVEVVTPPETAKRRATETPSPEARFRERRDVRNLDPEARPEPRPRERRETRNDDLEQRLERILKEVDELRRELRESNRSERK